jgi:hypothetical protein
MRLEAMLLSDLLLVLDLKQQKLNVQLKIIHTDLKINVCLRIVWMMLQLANHER